jgi:hypothetical protein
MDSETFAFFSILDTYLYLFIYIYTCVCMCVYVEISDVDAFFEDRLFSIIRLSRSVVSIGMDE